MKTYYVVEVFERSDTEGCRLIVADTIFCDSVADAKRVANAVHSYSGLGVLAWHRRGDMGAGFWEGLPELICQAGETPPLFPSISISVPRVPRLGGRIGA